MVRSTHTQKSWLKVYIRTKTYFVEKSQLYSSNTSITDYPYTTQAFHIPNSFPRYMEFCSLLVFEVYTSTYINTSDICKRDPMPKEVGGVCSECLATLERDFKMDSDFQIKLNSM